MTFKSVSFISVFLLIIVFSFVSCVKEPNSPIIHNIPQSALDQFFMEQRKPETFTVSSDQDINIVGSKGTELFIPEYMIPTSVTGDITISFKEYLNLKDLILADISTDATGSRLLETGGSFYLDIRDEQGGKVDISGQVSLTFPIRDNLTDVNGMTPWRGISEVKGEVEEWVEVSDSVESFIDVNTFSAVYTMFCPPYEWINCDDILDIPGPRSSISIDLTAYETTYFNTRVYLVGKNVNTVSSMWLDGQGRYNSLEFTLGDEAYVVVLHEDDGFYYKIEPVTIADGLNIDLELTSTNEAGIEQALEMFE